MITRFQYRVQLLICQGCCCGQTEQGKPEVPLTWLQRTWVERKLVRDVHITPTSCLGPCDVPNVACLLTARSSTWFAQLEAQEDYEAVLDWAAQLVGSLETPVPPHLQAKQLQRFTF